MPLPPPPPPLRPFNRPALVAALAVGLGIVLAEGGAGFGWWVFLLGTCALAAAGATWAMRRRLVAPRGLVWAGCAVVGAVALGGARMAAWQSLPPDHMAHLAAAAERAESAGDEAPLALWGRVAAPPQAGVSGLRVRLAADSAARAGRTLPVRGLVEVTLARPHYGDASAPVYPALEAGDRVRVVGPLRPLPRLRNPADFDYGAYLGRQGIGATLRLYDADAVRFLGSDAGPLTRLVTAVRAHVRRAALRFVRGEDERAVLVALLIADRSEIDPETKAAFAETGLTHLLAVSGLHILLVGMVLYGLLKPLLGRFGLGWRRAEVTRAVVTLAVLGVYALVTGATPSVVRAVVMAAVLIGGTLLQRTTDALNGLGVGALGLMLWRPAVVGDVGFQLSFAAVAAIVALRPTLTAWLPDEWPRWRPLRWLVDSAAVSLAATLGTAPILLYHFGQFPLAGLVLNLVAIPVTNVALGAGIAMALCVPWAPFVADAFAAVAEAFTTAMLWISRGGADGLDWLLIERFVRDPALVAALTLGLVALALWMRRRARWGLTCLGVAAVAASAWGGVVRGDARARLDAVFLDVGQGDAALLSLPGGRHVLVDCGLRDSYTDQGARTVVPHLRRFGIRRLDAVVLTHPHADHVGGLASVLRAVEVGRVVHTGQPSPHPLLAEAFAVADSLGVPLQVAQAGDTLALGPAVRARVLYPESTPPAWLDPNEGSVVLRVEFGQTSFLLTGDAEAGAEAALVARYGRALAADVVKVPHHGSRTSSTPALVAAAGVLADFAVVPVAERNRYGLPDEEPLARWAATHAAVLETGREGAVWLRSDGERVARVDWRE